MKFIYQLPIASMMILLFVSGLSVVRSEELQRVAKNKGLFGKVMEEADISIKKIDPRSEESQIVAEIKGLFGKGMEEAAISVKQIDPRSEESQKVAEIKGLFGKGMEKAAISVKQIEPYDSTAAEDCASLRPQCSSLSSPTGLFSLTYTNNNGGQSFSYTCSDWLWNQAINDPNFDVAPYVNTKDFYICTGSFNTQTELWTPLSGGCDLTRKVVDVGETFYFYTSSTDYTWSYSYPYSTAAEDCASYGNQCSSWNSPTGLFSLTYDNNGGQSFSYTCSDWLWNQALNDPNFDVAPYVNTKDFYICTGSFNTQTELWTAESGGCDLTRKVVDVGETYYFYTSSTDYTWSISYPNDDSLGGGAVAGIVIGVLVFLGCFGGLAFLVMNNRKKRAQPQTTAVELGSGTVTQQNPTVITTNAV